MAMNKREKEELEALRMERDMHRAMHISPMAEPDIHPPKGACGDGDFSIGWLPLTYSGGAKKAAVNSVYHRSGDGAWEKNNNSWAQGTRMLYSKRSAALVASRHHVSMDYAIKLALLDREIEKALAEEGKDKE